MSNVARVDGGWIGLTRNRSSDKWSNGADVTFSNLTGDCGSEPCCAAMRADGAWESLTCTEKRPFMCYKQDPTLNYTLTLMNMSWYEAQNYCRRSYTDLVSIRDQTQNEAVKTAGRNSNTSFWIGLLYNDWEWTDGGRSAYRNWGRYQPKPSTSSPSSDCVKLRKGKWETVPCSNTQYPLCYSSKS
ncbi:hypothetical protein NFI96_032289 [Prochilodus magdalenae]|nr:hypothetical protein NFI96_032289 [Prochilodus magdalenae]